MKCSPSLGLAVALAAALCAANPDARATEEAVQALGSVDAAAFDSAFLKILQTHLEHGSDLAALGAQRASGETVRGMATSIRTAQEGEVRGIETLRSASLDTPDRPPAAPSGPTTGVTDSEVMAAGGLPLAPSGLTLTLTTADPEPEPAEPDEPTFTEALPSHVEHAVTRAQNAAAREVVERLEGLNDAVFDETFTREMIAHLAVGKRIADTGRLRGTFAEIHTLAAAVSQRQQADLDRLRALIADL